jgi:hypothetical protein
VLRSKICTAVVYSRQAGFRELCRFETVGYGIFCELPQRLSPQLIRGFFRYCHLFTLRQHLNRV